MHNRERGYRFTSPPYRLHCFVQNGHYTLSFTAICVSSAHAQPPCMRMRHEMSCNLSQSECPRAKAAAARDRSEPHARPLRKTSHEKGPGGQLPYRSAPVWDRLAHPAALPPTHRNGNPSRGGIVPPYRSTSPPYRLHVFAALVCMHCVSLLQSFWFSLICQTILPCSTAQ